MGNEGSKSLRGGKSKKYSRNDGCIGDKGRRSICIGIALILVAGLGMQYIWENRKSFDDLKNSTTNQLTGGLTCNLANCDVGITTYTLIGVGQILICLFSLLAMIGACVKSCQDMLLKIVGIGLIAGGIMYTAGTCYYINWYTNTAYYKNIATATDDLKQRTNANIAAQFGESLIVCIAAVIFGLDFLMDFMSDEVRRLVANLGNLIVVSVLCYPCYYLIASKQQQYSLTTTSSPLNLDSEPSAFALMALGYTILFWVSLIYLIMWILTCCTCDCKDTACFRILMAIGITLGGVVTAVGYWIYASNVNNSILNTNYFTQGSQNNLVSYYVGYSLFIGIYPIIWALDIAFDDIKR